MEFTVVSNKIGGSPVFTVLVSPAWPSYGTSMKIIIEVMAKTALNTSAIHHPQIIHKSSINHPEIIQKSSTNHP